MNDILMLQKIESLSIIIARCCGLLVLFLIPMLPYKIFWYEIAGTNVMGWYWTFATLLSFLLIHL